MSIERTASVNADGTYRIDIPDEVLRDPAASLTIIGPRGEILAGALLSDVAADARTLKPITITGESPVAREDAEPVPVLSRKVMARVFLAREGVATGAPAAGAEVTILGLEAEAGTRQVLAAGNADRTGYASLQVPASKAERLVARARLNGSATEVELARDDSGFPPQRLVLVLTGQADAGAGAEDCHCELPPPRLPDAVELAENGQAFSTDLGTGCEDFTVPNRTLEEFDFFRIVRTTDPEIAGTTMPDTLAPEKVFGPLLKTVFDRNSLSELLSEAMVVRSREAPAEPSFAAMTAKAFRPEDTGAMDAATTLRESRTAPVETLADFRAVDALEAGGTIEAARWRDASDTAAAEAGLKRALGKLPLSAIRGALEDPDGFTPVNLMTMERKAVAGAVKAYLDNRIKSVAGRDELNQDNPPDWDATPKFYQATTVAHGHLLHYKQEWKADGYSLGELVKSIPLAPGQVKQIAILDWDREDRAARSEATVASEGLEAYQSRDRDINEIANASFREGIRGGSSAVTGAVGGGIGFAIGPLVIGGGGGSAWSSSSAWTSGSRSMSGETLNQLRDSTSQGVSSVRNLRSTVIETNTQSERVAATTEVIANHNRCHALTIQYFEVLRHFAVGERLAGVRECLFVPLQMTVFDDRKVLRWRDELRRACRQRALLGGIDAIERLSSPTTTPPNRAFADDPIEELSGRIFIRMSIARPKDPDEASRAVLETSQWGLLGTILHLQPEFLYERYRRNDAKRDAIFRDEIAPDVARNFLESLKVSLIDRDGNRHDAGLDLAILSKYRENGLIEIALNEAGATPRLARREISGVEIGTDHELPDFSSVVVERAALTYRTERLTHDLYRNNRVLDDVVAGDSAVLSTTGLSALEQRNLLKEDRTRRRRLIRHLNDNIEYYHRALWWFMDANRRFMLLDGIEAPNSGGRSVAGVVENRLIGVVGNALVLPVAPGFQLDPALGEVLKKNEDPLLALAELYDTEPSPPRRHSVPTKGVFAEAMTGKCNSCEIIEDDRFWRWKEFPLPDSPPPIEELSTDSRFAQPGALAATPFPKALIGYQTFEKAPDPTGMGAALGLLAKDVFKDITGLSENQKNAAASLTAALGASQSFAGEAFKLSLAQEASRNLDRTVDQIGAAKKAGLLTDEEASKATRDALLRTLGEDATSSKDITELPGVKEALNQLQTAPEGSAKISRSNGANSESLEVTKTASNALAIGAPSTAMTRPYPDPIQIKVDAVEDANLDGSTYGEVFATRRREALRFHLLQGGAAVGKPGDFVDVYQSLVDQGRLAEIGDEFEVLAQVRIGYPADLADTDKIADPDVPGEKFPLVVIIHGNSKSYTVAAPATDTGRKLDGKKVWTATIDSQANHEGYDYLQRALADTNRRIVSISIETNLANFIGSAVETRAQMVLKVIEELERQSADPASMLHDKVNFAKIGLMGHSRGGEAVVLAEMVNRAAGKSTVHAVCSLAPTDTIGITTNKPLSIAAKPPDCSYLVVYGGLDFDVGSWRKAGKRDFGGTGFRLYDRAKANRALVFLPDFCHTRFNSVWTAVGANKEAGVTIPATAFGEPAHRLIAEEYIGGFFDLILNLDGSQLSLFENGRANAVGAKTAILRRMGKTIEVLDDMRSALNLLRSIPAGTEVKEFAPVDLPASAAVGTRDRHVPHMTRALVMTTASVGVPKPKVTVEMGPGGGTRDFDGFEAVTFNLGMLYPVNTQTAINNAKLPVFTVTLIDAAGTAQGLTSAEMFAEMKNGWARPTRKLAKGSSGTNSTLLFLQTVAVPIAVVKAKFPSAAPPFQWSQVAKVEFEFDLAGGAGGKEIWLNDLLLVK